MEISDVGHTNFIVKVVWVQNPRSSPKSSQRLPTNTLHKSSWLNLTSKVTQQQIITHVDFLENQSLWSSLNFY